MAGDRFNHTNKTADGFSVKRQRTVMLVEDCEVDRALYRRYLERDAEYDYNFVEAETGESALEIYSQSVPDIILLDYLLPDLDGLDWFIQWQERHEDNLCPVIVLTGQGDEYLAVRFIKLGAADYYVKSQLTREKLKLLVDKAIATRQLQQEKDNLLAQVVFRNQQLAQSYQICQIAIDKKQQTQTALHIRLQQQAAISKLSEKALSEIELERLFSEATVLVAQMLGVEYCKVLKLSEDESTLLLLAGVGWSPGLVGRATVGTDLDSQAGYTLIAHEPVVVEDLRTEIRFSGPSLLRDHQVISGISTIIAGKRRPFGVLGVHSRQKVNFTRDDVNFVRAIANILATAVASQENKQILQQSEAKFRHTFEQAAVGMAHVALDGTWLMVNQKLCQIVGYTQEELLQTTFQKITHPEDLTSDLEYIRQLLRGEIATYSMEKRYIRQDNSLVWVNLTVSLVKSENEEPEYFISVIQEIGDRKNLEFSQQKTLQRLSNLHQLDKVILEARHPHEIATIAINNIQQLFNCQRASILTFNRERQTATILVAQGRARQTAGDGLVMALDIWQDAIEGLQQTESPYIVAYLNRSPQLSAAIPDLAASGLDCFVCFPLRVKNKLLGILKLWVENIEAVSLEELTMVGEISTQIAIALQQAHLTQAIQNYALDLENKVRKRTAQLEEINQELESYSYSISHDLRAPLRAIQGFAIALQEDYDEYLDDLGREYTERLAASAQQMERLIQDLLTYSRLSRTEIQKQSVNLSSLVIQVIKELDAEIKLVQAEITVGRPLLTVSGNRTILLQIVNNLLSNAIKFIPGNVKPQIHIWTEERENYVRLWVEDNGIGIKPQHQKRIFQVFERLHGNEAYPGTGIGLAIVKKGIERLGGRFGVESEVNRGSRFWIELPSTI